MEKVGEYKGYLIYWKSWLHSHANDCLYAQWIAYKPGVSKQDRSHMYASYPGGSGLFKTGDSFDIGVKPGQSAVNVFDEATVLSTYKQETYLRLTTLIDQTIESEVIASDEKTN